ncbi:CDGSH iron-sulfur domain-containing protein 3, mitochondrial isoform X2 [Dermochelys coriacea]|uniref:CDGSH iron-sulfur domain-containing protein 3, mitochondrial isoform X2 n=1 Tax=Dermochelys coriacea TaxID=27794 RepID=UPI0018E7545F|nr:CDGSH iron-sulfur domain-containing protein 3, mitochondrial isoform X2 [Dermochelys coriacea]
MPALQRPAALATLVRSSSGTSSSPSQPAIAAKHPYQVDLKAGKLYAWCTCGHSKKQPFCDGSHKTATPDLSPLRFRLDEAKSAWLCGCKHTKSPPYCDGTHKEEFIQKAKLPGQP